MTGANDAAPDPLRDIRLGTLLQLGRGIDPVAAIHALAPYGFESFQLAFPPGLHVDGLAELTRTVGAATAATDTVISALGLYGNALGERPDDEATRAGWAALVDAAPDVGCDVVSGFTGRVRDRPLTQSLEPLRRVFAPLAERAAGRGVRLAFENCAMGGDWRTGDWNIALDPAAWALIFEALDAPHVGLEWEPCHQLLALADPLPQIAVWAPRIFHVHGKDAVVRHDAIRRHGVLGAAPLGEHRLPGFGDSDWRAVLGELRRAGFRGAIDVEGWHDPVFRGELETTGQVAALRHLQRCRGEAFVPNPPGFG